MKSVVNISLLLVALLLSCDKLNYYPETNQVLPSTKILAHRGKDISMNIEENTLAAVTHSLAIVDGVEVDIHVSADGTLWLAHDIDLPDCGQYESLCFPETSDDDIIAIDSCNGSDHTFDQLESVFDYMSTNYPDAKISVDVKYSKFCSLSSLGVGERMKEIGEEIVRLAQLYNMERNVMIDSRHKPMLRRICELSSEIECYLTAYTNFNKHIHIALENGFEGLSYKYKSEQPVDAIDIELLHNQGLKIHLWTVNDTTEIKNAISLKPDYILSSNLDYFQ